MRVCTHCQAHTEAPVCPVDDRPTLPLPGEPPASDSPSPSDGLLAVCRLDEYWGSDESGGMYRGTMLATGSAVSVRIIRPDLSADEAYTLAFEQQAERCRQLATHRVAKVLQRGRTGDGRLFLITEYVQGRSLRQLIDDGEPLGWVRLREITLQLLEGLAEGHRAGLVHWDLRPEIVWFEAAAGGGPPNLRLTGFGLPWWPPRGPEQEGGTRPSVYAAPQRFAGGIIEERSDLYALGACLFHVLTGRPPLSAPLTPEAAVERRAGARPDLSLPRDAVPSDVPAGFLDLVQRLMAWSPADRPRDADAVTRLVSSLPEAVVHDAEGRAVRLPEPGGESGPERSSPTAYGRWVLVALLLLAIAALLWLLLAPGAQSRETRADAKPEQLSSVAPSICRARS